MQEAKLELPALVVVDLEEELIVAAQQKAVLRIHPLAIREGALLLCTKSDGRWYTVGNYYKVINIDEERPNYPVLVEDDFGNDVGHSWSLEALAGIGKYKDYETQFILLAWT